MRFIVLSSLLQLGARAPLRLRFGEKASLGADLNRRTCSARHQSRPDIGVSLGVTVTAASLAFDSSFKNTGGTLLFSSVAIIGEASSKILLFYRT
jgi:hypothetical protein